MNPNPQALVLEPMAVAQFRQPLVLCCAVENPEDRPSDPAVLFTTEFRAGADGILFV